MAQSSFFSQLFSRLYQWIVSLETKIAGPLLLIIRLYWGWQFTVAGLTKLLDIGKVIGFFKTIGIPYPEFNAMVVGLVEFLGGLSLLLGLGCRLSTIPLLIVMIVAYITVDHAALWELSSLNVAPFIKANPFLFLYAVLIVMAFGPGKYSLDHILKIE